MYTLGLAKPESARAFNRDSSVLLQISSLSQDSTIFQAGWLVSIKMDILGRGEFNRKIKAKKEGMYGATGSGRKARCLKNPQSGHVPLSNGGLSGAPPGDWFLTAGDSLRCCSLCFQMQMATCVEVTNCCKSCWPCTELSFPLPNCSKKLSPYILLAMTGNPQMGFLLKYVEVWSVLSFWLIRNNPEW